LYYPFGEVWTGIDLNSFNMHQTFAQLADYDPEIDMYNTPNRHYSPSGRWLSPDPGGMSVIRLDAPQTWNMYAYVANNPTTLADPSGLDPTPAPDSNILKDSDPGSDYTPKEKALATQNATNTAQTAVSSLTILGQNVKVTYVGLRDEQKQAASDKLVAAENTINGAKDLTDDEKAAIHKVQSISVSAGEGKDDPRTGIDASGNENFRFSYLNNPGSTAAWTASAMAHDAYHLVTDPKGTLYGPDTAAGLEKKCNEFQMQVGAKFGLTQDQLDWIKNDTHTLYNTNPY
jgi:RHS repeat-associated protein